MRLLEDRRGAELSEVGLVLALVVVVAVVALRLLGANISDVLNRVASTIGGG